MNLKLNLQDRLKFDARTRFLSIIMVLVLLGVVYHRRIYGPRAKYLKATKERYLALKEEHSRLESTLPDAKAEQEKFRQFKEKYDTLTEEVAKKEKALPKNVNIPDILRFLVKEKEKHDLKLKNIICRKDQAGEIPLYKAPAGSKQQAISYYSYLPIEIEMYGSFEEIIKYIEGIERQLPYQRISSLQIDMRKTSGGKPNSILTVLSILGRGQEQDEDLAEFQTALKQFEELEFKTDPFQKKERPRVIENLREVMLNGIVWKKDKPYAVINNSLYSVGESVGGKKIIKIDKDEVLFESEDKLFRLTPKSNQ